MNKRQIIDELIAEAQLIHAGACDPETRVVWGEGNLDAQIVIVGEAPGAQEDKQGHPFVGAAGKLLDREFARAGILRSDVYITNIVKCRPVLVQSGRRSNRTPNMKEINAWRDILMREIQVIAPHVLICLGAVAASALIHPKFSMNAERGQWFDGPLNTRAIATFHPAYLLRVMDYDQKPLYYFRTDLDAAVNEVRGVGVAR